MRHNVDQARNVAVVYVGRRLHHLPDLLEQACANSLDAQNLQDLADVVRHGPSLVHLHKREHLEEVIALGVEIVWHL